MREITCTVSGSLKFKPEIDQVITTFEGAGFKVKSMRKSGLFNPPTNHIWLPGSHPLSYERNLSERQARRNHERKIGRVDFNYFVAVGGYIGLDVSREGGLALGAKYNKLAGLYVSEPIDPTLGGDYFEDLDRVRWEEYINMFEVKSPEEVIELWRNFNPDAPKLWFPRSYIADEYNRAHPPQLGSGI